MSVTVRLYLEDVNSYISDSYTTLNLYRDTDPAGDFNTLIDSITLVEDDLDYEVEDPTGTASHFYRYTLYTGALESALSELINPFALSLLRLRLGAAMDAGAATHGTADASGCTTTRLAAAGLSDDAVDANFGEGWWIYRPDATQPTDRVRRVDSYNVAGAYFEVARAWANAPASEVFHLYRWFPPIDTLGQTVSWTRLVQQALRDIWFEDELNLGPGLSTNPTRFSLAAHLSYITERSIRGVLLRTYDSNDLPTDIDAGQFGRWWKIIRNLGSLSVELHPAPSTRQHVIVQVNRTYEPLARDSDVTTGPEELARRAVVARAYDRLRAVYGEKWTLQAAVAERDFQLEYARWRPTDAVLV